MGLQGIHARFSATPPALRAIVEGAMHRGGLPISIVRSDERSLVVAFAAFPDGLVTILSDASSVELIDYSLSAPTLFCLLQETLLSLGAEAPRPAKALSLPLTDAMVRRAQWMVYGKSVGCLACMLSFLAVILGGLLWAILRVI